MQQLAMLDGMDKTQQLQMLEEALADNDDRELERLHREWRDGDADELATHMVSEMRTKYPAMYARINTERNDTWVPKLEARPGGGGHGRHLVVVGAMHLLGQRWRRGEAAQEGLQVERICTACSGIVARSRGGAAPRRRHAGNHHHDAIHRARRHAQLAPGDTTAR
jgi:uncharacterized protein YbaP (TraB family)